MAYKTFTYIALLVVVLASACSHSSPTEPTTPPVPTNPASTYSLSGTVTETTPTASQVVPGASVTIVAGLDTGVSAIADAEGRYILSKLRPGTLSLRSSAAGYDDALQTLTLTGDRSGLGFQLNPTAVMVDAQYEGVSNGEDRVCESFEVSARLPCKTYQLALHSAGTVTAVLNWDDSVNLASALALELVREPGTNQGDRIELNFVTQGNPNREEVSAILAPGLYSVRVLYQRQLGPQAFTLTMSYPR